MKTLRLSTLVLTGVMTLSTVAAIAQAAGGPGEGSVQVASAGSTDAVARQAPTTPATR